MKEAHYWDTFESEALGKQIRAFDARLISLHAERNAARQAGRRWQVDNLTRRIASLSSLVEVLRRDRTDDLEYAAWLMEHAGEARLVADITPSYALIPDRLLERMLQISPMTRFVYLIRDPIDRLWSHVRMQARRVLRDGEDFARKAHTILGRVMRGQEQHISVRGDYPATISKLRRVLPGDRLFIDFAETVFEPAGLKRLSAFLGVSFQPAKPQKIHGGHDAPMQKEARSTVAAHLQDQYDWVAMNVAPLPRTWQDNLQRAMA